MCFIIDLLRLILRLFFFAIELRFESGSRGICLCNCISFYKILVGGFHCVPNVAKFLHIRHHLVDVGNLMLNGFHNTLTVSTSLLKLRMVNLRLHFGLIIREHHISPGCAQFATHTFIHVANCSLKYWVHLAVLSYFEELRTSLF